MTLDRSSADAGPAGVAHAFIPAPVAEGVPAAER
jgi:hypothetical protein